MRWAMTRVYNIELISNFKTSHAILNMYVFSLFEFCFYICFDKGEEGFQLLTWSKDQVLKLWNLDPRCWQVCMQ